MTRIDVMHIFSFVSKFKKKLYSNDSDISPPLSFILPEKKEKDHMLNNLHTLSDLKEVHFYFQQDFRVLVINDYKWGWCVYVFFVTGRGSFSDELHDASTLSTLLQTTNQLLRNIKNAIQIKDFTYTFNKNRLDSKFNLKTFL